MTEQAYWLNERIDEVLVSLGDLAPIAGDTDDFTLATIVAKGLWAGFYLAHRHPEWLAALIQEGNGIIDDQINADLDWDEAREWSSIVDKLIEGVRPL